MHLLDANNYITKTKKQYLYVDCLIINVHGLVFRARFYKLIKLVFCLRVN